MSLEGLGSSSLADEHNNSTQERQSANLPSSNMASDPAVPPRTMAIPVQQPSMHQVNMQQGTITSVGQPLARVLPPSGSTVTSLPVLTTTANLVAISTDGQTSLKQVGVPCTMLPLTSSTTMVHGGITRPNTTMLPLQTMQPHISASYHVPRGAAAVANISAPRSAVATPIIRPTLSNQSSVATGPSLSTSFVPSLRGLTPRALAPATWHGTANTQPASNPPRANVFTPGRPTAMTVSARPMGIQVNRDPPKQQTNLHSPGQKTIAVQQSTTTTQLQIAEKGFFKSTVSVQSGLGSVTIAQLVPARSQNVTYTSSPLTSSAPVPFLQTTATTQHITRPILASVQAPARHGPPALTTPVRLAVSTQAGPTAGQGNITPGSRLTTLSNTALSTIPTSTILSTGLSRGPVHTRMTMAQTAPRSANNPTVIATTSSVITNHARLQVTSPGMMQQGATLLTSQARLTVASGVPTSALGTAGVVSLHPVVVSNTNPSLPMKTTPHPQLVAATTNRVISAHQPLGPKVITQSTHGPSIQIAQVPVSSFSSKIPQAMHNIVPLQQTAIAITTIPNRSVPFSTNTTMATGNSRPVAMMPAPGKVTEVSVPLHSLQGQQTQQQQSANLFIQTAQRSSPAPSVAVERPSYSTTYYYETPSGYQVAGVSSSIVTRPYAPPSAPYTIQNPAITTHGIVTSNQPVRFNPVMVVDQSRSTTMPVSYMTEAGALLQTATPLSPNSSSMQPVMKLNASPRPSILRKRDNEGSPMKAQRNLGPVLAALGGPPSPLSPRRPDSGGGGNGSSGGSTTISATSSPGLNEVAGDDSQPASLKQEPDEADRAHAAPPEMSPRKKPRKQQLTGNELQEPKFSEDDMEFISEEKIQSDIKEEPEESEVVKVCFPKRPNISLISSYRHSWKSRHNHFVRYGDVKPKDERRPTVVELASQKQIMQRLNGWKIYHLSTQMEDMGDLETQVVDKLTGTLKVMEKKLGKEADKDMNRINELIKGNIQRSIVIRDQIQEAKSQVMKIFDHKCHVADIIGRCANKRSFKKREKS